MNAREIWATQGGLLNSYDGRLMVDLHAMRETSKPSRNIRFRFQVMADDDNQSHPVQFRGEENAHRYLMGSLPYTTLLDLILTKRARLCF